MFPLLILGSPYEIFAGRDASRALATFSLDSSSMREDYDDLSDLRSDQMSGLKEWELQFSGKFFAFAHKSNILCIQYNVSRFQLQL